MAKKGKPEKKAKREKKPKGFRKIVNLTFLNDTKGTHRYQEVDDGGDPIESDEEGKVIGGLYIRKSAMDGVEPPQELVLIIMDKATAESDVDLDTDDDDED